MIGFITKKGNLEKLPQVKWLRLCASSAMGKSSVPSQETKIPHATPHGQKIIITKGNLDKTCIQKEHCVKIKAESEVMQ